MTPGIVRVIGVTEGMKEDKASWEQFIRSLIERGLKGVRLVVGDRCAGLVSTVNAMLPDAGYQRCMVHFIAQRALQGQPQTHGMGRVGAQGHIRHGIPGIRVGEGRMRGRADGIHGLKAAASCLREGVGEATTYLLDEYPVEHRRRIRTNNMIERLNREIRRRTRVVGSFPDRQERAHARLRAHPLRHRQPMVHAPLPGHVPAR